MVNTTRKTLFFHFIQFDLYLQWG